MLHKELNQGWKMRRAGDSGWLEARVPGSVYTDLLANGCMEDPYWKDNEEKALALMEEDYEYETEFCLDKAWDKCSDILLCLEGIDTLGEITVNGRFLGKTFSMHRSWEYSLEDVLLEGQNTLRIRLRSPLQYIREKFAQCPTYGSEDAMDGFVHIRKAHYMFGWDWGAHLPDAGIFRPVWLRGVEKARIRTVEIHQEHREDMVRLHLRPQTEKDGAFGELGEDYEYQAEITGPRGETEVYPGSPKIIEIPEPQLWWPNGLGPQNLYRLRVSLTDKATGARLDSWERRIGLRTMTVCREKDAWGESFAHEVNGRTVFAMGADYIPEDHLLGKVSRERTRKLLLQCREANFNAIRVWGGGYYPEDWFFDLCDELGLMVWQDFMFACAVYELTEEFRENICQEFIENVLRIRHHACLALWCGNNEMEQFVSEGHHWVTKHSEVRDYLLMYEELIPRILKQYDPDTFYWPASPSSGGTFDAPNDPDRGDVHYWEVWHGNKPFTEYRKHFFRYASEFGFQSFPALETIRTFTDAPKDFNPFSYIMEKHQRNYGANGKIMNYLQQTYLYPRDFPVFIYASQLLQADAIRYGVEHFRRNRGRCMGAIYWQLNDCWPVISWSSIDYCGRWKALHYYAKRFFAPLMISCEEEGFLTAETDMNREHFQVTPSIRLNVANETLHSETLMVCWELREATGQILSSRSRELEVPALSSQWLEKVPLPQADIFSQYVSYSLWKEEEKLSEGTVIFSLPKYFQYQDPGLSWELDGDELIIHSKAYAKSVEIQNKEETLRLSDNYFDLNGDCRRVKILEGKAEEIRIRSVWDIQ